MADNRRPPSPGWYPDVEDRGRLRHWDGVAWIDRYRPRPPWSVQGVHLVVREQTAFDGGRSASARLVHQGRRSSRAGERRSRPPAAPEPPSSPLSASEWAPHLSDRGVRPARRLTGLTLFLAVAVTVVVVAAGVSRPRGPFSTVNTAFATRADTTCSTALTPVHGAGASSAGISGADPARIDPAASRVEQLAGEMEAWPETRSAGAEIPKWLGLWHRYGSEEHHFAALLRASAADTAPGAMVAAATTKAQHLADQAAGDAREADGFALSNGLQACTLLTRAASPGLVSAP